MRYIIVDFMHMPHLAKFLPPLTDTLMVEGVPTVINTQVPTMVIKSIFNKSARGDFYTAVLFDGTHLAGSYRKEYFRSLNSKWGLQQEYKSDRREHPDFFQAVELTQYLIIKGEMSVYRIKKLEADDLVASLINRIRYGENDWNTPIDVYTNDADLLPFVDDQVSVYMRGGRTHAELGCPQSNKYFQVTPETWDDYLIATSEYKKYHIPYNSMLLYKLIKGDASDTYKGAISLAHSRLQKENPEETPPKARQFGPKAFHTLVSDMLKDGIDFHKVFRYDVDFDAVIRPAVEKYFSAYEVEAMNDIFVGIRPIMSLDGVNWIYQKIPKPLQIHEGYLQAACNKVGINLNA